MPDYKLNIIGTFNNKQLVKALRKAGVDVKKLGKETEKTNKKMGAFRQATAGLRRTLGAVRNNLLLVTFALGGVAAAVKKTTGMFAEFEKINIGFKNLGESAGLSENALQTLTDATDGTVNSMELMRQANNAMLLGIVESEEQMGEMFDVAQRLASALGKDTLFGIESLTTGIGRQCLTSDSFISTKEGMKQITDIEDGDIVLSCNDDGEIIETGVTHLHDNGVQPVYIVTFKDGKYIKSTGNHRYLTEDGWKCLDDLDPGAKVISIDNGYSEIYSIDFFGEEQVYDLTVPETANFFANGLCVHNSRLMLDNLGIIVKSDVAYKEYAKTLKKTVSELTEQERKTAFINAAMTAAREKVKALGEEQLTTKDAFNQATVAVSEMAIEMGDFFAEAAVEASTGIKSAADSLGEFFRQLSETSLETAVRQLQEMGSAAEDIALLQNLIDIESHQEALFNNNEKIEKKLINQVSLTKEQMENLGATVKWVDAIAQMGDEGTFGPSSADLEYQKRIVSLSDTEKVTQKAIREEIKKIQAENLALSDTRGKLSSQAEHEIELNTYQHKLLAEILLLVKQRENAERVLFGIEEDRIKLLSGEDGGDVDGGDAERERLDYIIPKYDEYLGKLKKVWENERSIAQIIKDQKKAKEDQINMGIQGANKMASAMVVLAKGNKQQAIAALHFSQGAAMASAIAGSMKAFEKGGIGGFIMGTALFVEGLARVQQINQQISELKAVKAAQFGLDEIVTKPTLILAGEGSKAEHVGITPLEGPNMSGPQGSGQNITLNISAPLVDDTVVDSIIPAIREALRRGEDIGIS